MDDATPIGHPLRGFGIGSSTGAAYHGRRPAHGRHRTIRRRSDQESGGRTMTATIESAWPRYPDYSIDVSPCHTPGQVWQGDVLLAESGRCLLVKEFKHADRLYFPEDDVHWELFEPTSTIRCAPSRGRRTTGAWLALTAPSPTWCGHTGRPSRRWPTSPGTCASTTSGSPCYRRETGPTDRSSPPGSHPGATSPSCCGFSTCSPPGSGPSSGRARVHQAQRRRGRPAPGPSHRRCIEVRVRQTGHLGVHGVLTGGVLR